MHLLKVKILVHSVSFFKNVDSSKYVYTIEDIDTYLSQRNCSEKDCFFYLELEANDKAVAPDNFILPHQLKECNIGHPNVQVNIQSFYKIVNKFVKNSCRTYDVSDIFYYSKVV